MGSSWGVLERLGTLLWSLRSVLGASWSVLRASWEPLGASWEALGSILDPSWEAFGAQEGLGKHLGSDCLEL